MWKHQSSGIVSSITKAPMSFSNKAEKALIEQREGANAQVIEKDINVDIKEVYFLIMHFLSLGPCQRTFGQFYEELMEHQLLPRRYHAWYSRSGASSVNDCGDGVSLPLNYDKLVERYAHIERDHLVKLMKQLLLHIASPVPANVGGKPNAADVPTLLGSGSFSLLDSGKGLDKHVKAFPGHLHWPHMLADQVHGLSLREIGGGFAKHHRAPSVRAACYAIAKPSTMVQKMQTIKKIRGHRNAVYCAIFDRLGRYVITGSDDRLVKIWSMETAFCLASCRGHEGDITDLAVSSNNAVVASASNDFVIRVWRLPDGMPISVLRGHTGAVTAIAFSPRPATPYQLLSSSDDGTCRIWDARFSQCCPRIYVPKPSDAVAGKINGSSSNGPSSSNALQNNQILCCAYNSNGTVFVTGSSDTYARVWSACRSNADESEQPIHEMDVLAGHENDVNYVQFSGCAVTPKISTSEALKEDHIPKFKNSWYSHDNIVTCSRDGSAIIWAPKSRRSHGKSMRWIKSYHLKVPPPPLPPQPPRGGPRQRILPTPRGVNMIVWSLDNRFVLAAIMDCRICVWNAGDGSLVHSLTGHTESSYVLDVHPFNPRIAMSAGYDGKTIIWDIWEGIPIRTYEIGRFKLVDGKFSPDGTSIVLSDDVGQIYLLNTGQGDSQKDAKYDQFFLGDYRPLIRDTSGNVVDQETQFTPYKRNIQDPLCDSSMVPYTEPYQTMFQRRRLGALGIEWRPSSMRFAIGPDINLGQDYQMPPLEDLDRIIDPLPEFIDAIYWEPDNEIISDDNDSEYNVAEESGEGEQVSIGSGSSSDQDCSENSDVEHSQKDGLRRSRRRKHKSEVDISSSSGRRVKKRNLDERAASISRSNGAKKLKNGRKISKRKSSKAHTSRPQRIAARNAINMFSKIKGASTDGEDDDDDSGSYTSNSDLELLESNFQSDLSDRYLQNVQEKHRKDQKLAVVDEKDTTNPRDVPESQDGAGNRKKLVFKISLRDSKKLASTEDSKFNDENQTNIAKYQQNRIHLSRDSGSSSISGVGLSQNQIEGDIAEGQPQKIDDFMEESVGNDGNKIKWGEIKIRTSKRLRLGDVTLDDACIGNGAGLDAHKESRNDSNGNDEQFGTDILQHQDGAKNEEIVSPNLINSSLFDSSPPSDIQSKHNASGTSYNATAEGANLSWSESHQCRNGDLQQIREVSNTSHSQELRENSQPKITKLKIRTKGISGGPGTSSEMKSSYLEQNQALSKLEKGEDSYRSTSLYEVHKMERSNKVEAGMGNSYNDMEDNTSNAVEYDDSEEDLSEDSTDAIRRTRSMRMKATSREPNSIIRNFRKRDGHELVGTSKNTGKDVLFEEKMPSSKKVPKTTRNNEVGNYESDTRFLTRRKLDDYPVKKLSWLILSEHEDAYRYIPQQGDEVIYLRQGHQEYIESIDTTEKGPWTSTEKLRAVEVCKVESLVYSTFPGSGDSCCKFTLRFIDPSSKASGKAFKLTLPELISFPDFIVERTRYDDAVSRSWLPKDKCVVWWRNENGEDGSWWEGKIESSQAKSPEFPDSPWERFNVCYDTKPPELHLHSPWELHDPDVPWKHPCIDFWIKDKLLSSFSKLDRSITRNQDYYGIQKLNDASQKLDFVNRFPVPLYPAIIEARLENNYYRSFEAVKHDIHVMMENAQAYFAKNAALSKRMKRLSDWYMRKLSELEDL